MAFSEQEKKQLLTLGEPYSDAPAFEQQIREKGILTSDLLKTQPDLSKQLIFINPNRDIFPVSSLNAGIPQAQPTIPETKADILTERLQKINEQLLGQEIVRTQNEEEFRLSEQRKTEAQLAGQLKQLQAEALAIPIRLQQEAVGKGITASGLAPIQMSQLRENAIRALSVSSLLEATRGNIVTAQSLAERAVQQKFAPLEEEKRALIANLELIQKSPVYTLAQRNRAEQRKALEEERLRVIERQKNEEKEIKDITNIAIKYGLTDPLLIKQLSESSTLLEARQKAAPFLQDPKARIEFEQTRLENIIKQKEIEKRSREEVGLSEKELAKQKEIDEATQNALFAAQDKVNLINGLINHKGLRSSVGPITPLRRDIIAGFTGQKMDFIAGINLLIQKETLDTLINLKKAGGTLGALSEGEARMLREAASKIGSWIEKDRLTGEVIGFKVTEKLFKKELERIQELAQRALTRAQGEILSVEEKSLLGDMFSITPMATTSFNPAGYF